MKKGEIIIKLLASHQEFVDFLNNLSKEEFEFQFQDKWTAGQQMEHILLSVKPLKKALLIPNFILKSRFGVANRPSKTYEELVKRYTEKLNIGGVAPSPFLPAKVPLERRTALTKELLKNVQKLNSKVKRYSEDELDLIILPHPLLGKVTLREMFYFTIHHVGHHMKITKTNLESYQ